MSDSKNDNKRDPWRAFVLIAIIVIVIQILGGFAIHHLVESEQRGTFGDMFGAVNTLFSGLAFAGVIYAIILQREELRLQREELTLTREELAKSAVAHQESANLLKQQVALQSKSSQPSFSCQRAVVLDHDPGAIQFDGDPDPDIRYVKLRLINKGAAAFSLRAHELSNPDAPVSFSGKGMADQTEAVEMKASDLTVADSYAFIIYYESSNGEQFHLAVSVKEDAVKLSGPTQILGLSDFDDPDFV